MDKVLSCRKVCAEYRYRSEGTKDRRLSAALIRMKDNSTDYFISHDNEIFTENVAIKSIKKKPVCCLPVCKHDLHA